MKRTDYKWGAPAGGVDRDRRDSRGSGGDFAAVLLRLARFKDLKIEDTTITAAKRSRRSYTASIRSRRSTSLVRVGRLLRPRIRQFALKCGSTTVEKCLRKGAGNGGYSGAFDYCPILAAGLANRAMRWSTPRIRKPPCDAGLGDAVIGHR